MFDQSLIKGNVAVLFGGESSERDVSLNSGQAVIQAFNRLEVPTFNIDVASKDLSHTLTEYDIKHVFNILHGGDGENGTVQALLNNLGISFTGSDVLGCAVAMDKQRTKLLWKGAGIPTADFMPVTKATSWADVTGRVGDKVMIKPSNEGSSIGMSLVDSEAGFNAAMSTALRYDSEVIAEKWLAGEEYTVAVLGDVALPMIRLKTENQFYDYEAKYQSNDTQYLCPCGLSDDEEAEIQAIALKAFSVLGCSGWGRIDVMKDDDGQFYLLEANTVPGMTDHSLVPMAAVAAGMSFDSLVAEILRLSLQ